MSLEAKIEALTEAVNTNAKALITALAEHAAALKAGAVVTSFSLPNDVAPAEPPPATQTRKTRGRPAKAEVAGTVEAPPNESTAPFHDSSDEVLPADADDGPADADIDPDLAAGPGPSIDDVRAAAFKVKDLMGAPAAQALVRKHGAGKLVELDETVFVDFIADCTAAIAEYEAGDI